MSTSENLFFDPNGRTPLEATEAVAAVLSVDMATRADTPTLLIPLADSTGCNVIASVEENDYRTFDPDPSNPEHRSIFDHLPMLFDIDVRPKPRTLDLQQQAALDMFRNLASSTLCWPLVLTHEFDILIATYDVERGIREFPPGTRSDGTDEHLWR